MSAPTLDLTVMQILHDVFPGDLDELTRAAAAVETGPAAAARRFPQRRSHPGSRRQMTQPDSSVVAAVLGAGLDRAVRQSHKANATERSQRQRRMPHRHLRSRVSDE